MSEIYEQPFIFQDSIDPQDINQGQLGDCYFLAVLSSMAEDPVQIFSMFHTKQINKAGCYLVLLYVNGVRRSVVLDDYLPCRYGKPTFAHSKVSDVWACLVEKAWAKLHGSYEKIDKGSACVAASMLQGVPSWSVEHRPTEDLAEFKRLIKTCKQRHFTVISSTYGTDEVQY